MEQRILDIVRMSYSRALTVMCWERQKVNVPFFVIARVGSDVLEPQKVNVPFSWAVGERLTNSLGSSQNIRSVFILVTSELHSSNFAERHRSLA